MNLRLTNALATCVLVASCGGGGGGSDNSSASSNSAAILTVNKDGVYKTAPYANSTNLAQNSTSGYFISPFYGQEWTGSGLGYSPGYVIPTSGRLFTFKVMSYTGDLWWSASNLNYNIASTAPSVDSSVLPFDALLAANETKVYGGASDDKTLFFMNTTEVDLGQGVDTLVLSQNYEAYRFTRVTGSTAQVYVARGSSTSLVKNVELFQFANTTRTIAQILAAIP